MNKEDAVLDTGLWNCQAKKDSSVRMGPQIVVDDNVLRGKDPVRILKDKKFQVDRISNDLNDQAPDPENQPYGFAKTWGRLTEAQFLFWVGRIPVAGEEGWIALDWPNNETGKQQCSYVKVDPDQPATKRFTQVFEDDTEINWVKDDGV